MKKLFLAIIAAGIFFYVGHAQNDTMYIMKSGNVIGKYKAANVDSVIFYKPVIISNMNIETVNIPAGTFIMGSPSTEVDRSPVETQHTVTLSAFRMSKFEITNEQYAAFLNAKAISKDGSYTTSLYGFQTLILANSYWGLTYSSSKWVPVAGYENNPVINVSWYGANEFAAYAGCRLPTEAEWEYACRAGTDTPFNTGGLLTNGQANYNWAYPYNGGTNTQTTYPNKTQAVGTYPANAWGLFDMHGNVWEWCADMYGPYPTIAQTNPTGSTTGTVPVTRGGGFNSNARDCRSADRANGYSYNGSLSVGFRVVFPQ